MTTEPRTEAGRKVLPWLAAHYFNGGGILPAEAHDRAVAELAAIETEAREQAWTEIGTRYVTHAEEAERRIAAVDAARAEAARLALEDVAERVDKELGRVEREYAKQGDLALAEAQLTAVLALLSTKEEGS